MSLGKPNFVVLEGYFYARIPLYFVVGYYLFFGMGDWIFAVSFFRVSRLSSPGCCVFPGRRMQCLGILVPGCWAFDSSKDLQEGGTGHS